MIRGFYLIGIAFIFISLYCITYFIAQLMMKKKWSVSFRLQTIREMGGPLNSTELLNLPFKDRIIIPMLKKIGEVMESATPSRIKQRLEEKLVTAGYSQKTAVTNFLTIQGVLLGTLPTFLILLGIAAEAGFGEILFIGILGFLTAFMLPTIMLNSKKNKRQKRIRRSLPETLDLLVVSVEAGLGFDAALTKVTEKTEGPLSDEFAIVLNEIKLGKVRKAALKDMADRTGVDPLISFVSAIIQAEQLGVSIGNVLRVQADDMRTYQRQMVEEQIAKAPIKMLFPLMFCIFPALFAVIMGPAALQLIEIFSNM